MLVHLLRLLNQNLLNNFGWDNLTIRIDNDIDRIAIWSHDNGFLKHRWK